MLTLTAIKNVERNTAPQGVDLFIAACGYEGRAIAAAQQLAGSAKKRLALGFTLQRELDYQSNSDWFTSAGFDVIDVGDDEFRTTLDQYISNHLPATEILTVEIDISCFNRFRLAHLIDAIRSTPKKKIVVNFRYSIADFTPPVGDSAPTVTVEPVIPQFAGWTTRPDRPPAAIVGLGYEPNKAIGIIDHLEINNATWAFYPLGPIPEYYQSVLKANNSLLALIQTDGRCQPYDLNDPAQLFREMNSLVDTLKPHFNAILIPFGPKLFALIALLVASLHDEVGVWRVSSGSLEAAVSRKPSGHIVSISTTFRNMAENPPGID